MSNNIDIYVNSKLNYIELKKNNTADNCEIINHQNQFSQTKQTLMVGGAGTNARMFKLTMARNTASYIYTRDSKGVYYFAVARKVPMGARVRLQTGMNTGAAGTNPKYMGKWGSFGGKKDKKSKHDFHASILEIRDEGQIHNLSHKSDVHIKWANQRYNRQLLVLEFAQPISSSTVLFIYNIPDHRKFFSLFPKFPAKRGGAKTVTASHGEIDYVSSLSMRQMVALQTKELNKGDNFFLSYFCDSFNRYVLPILSSSFKKKWPGGIKYTNDKRPRTVIPMPKFREVRKGVYQ